MLGLPRLAAFALLLAAGFEPIASGATSSTARPGTAGRPFHVEFNLRVPMRDGVALAATIVQPPDISKKRPIVLVFTPYGADRYYPVARYFARHGYVGAIVEARGRGDSGGTFTPYVNDARDAYDAIEWLARQPYADGRVVMRGASYTGNVQWLVAALAPPSLKTIAPAASSYLGVDSPSYRGVGNPYRARWAALVAGRQRNTNWNEDLEYWRGLFAELGRGAFTFRDLEREAGFDGPLWPEALDHPTLDAFWSGINPSPTQLAGIRIPVLAITGAYDGAEAGTREHWRRFAAANPEGAARSRLLIGPWDHAGVTTPQRLVGGLDFGEAATLDLLGLHLAWFEHVLNGAPPPAQLRDRFTYYVLGAQEWRGAPVVGDGAMARPFHASSPSSDAGALARAGTLSPTASRADIDRFQYDPLREAIAWGPYFGSETGSQFLVDDAFLPRMDGDGLVYETEPFARDVELVGWPRVTLVATLDVPDTDFVAVLYSVAPDGRLQRLAFDSLRARYREGLDRPRLVPIGKPQTYRLELGWVAQRLPSGHRLRLLITSPGISYLYQRNRNSGGDVSRETPADARVANVSVALGARGTRVWLPLREVTP